MINNRSKIVIGLGGNLPFRGDPTATSLVRAIKNLASDDVVIRSVSRFFRTPCFPAGAGPDYVNAAIMVRTTLDPVSLMHRLHAVEAAFDRERAQRWGRRTMDLDLLAHGQMVLPDAETQKRWMDLPAGDQVGTTPDRLIVPHPRLQDRAFVLVPMADVVPDWVHPVLGKSVRGMCEALDPAEIRAIRPI